MAMDNVLDLYVDSTYDRASGERSTPSVQCQRSGTADRFFHDDRIWVDISIAERLALRAVFRMLVPHSDDEILHVCLVLWLTFGSQDVEVCHDDGLGLLSTRRYIPRSC